MKYKWLNKENNKDLIIFFNGWGMDEEVVKHLDKRGFEIVSFYDYNDLETDFFHINQPDKYSNIFIISWSAGVMISALICDKYKIKPALATVINGTFEFISPLYGINPKIYDLTLKGFNVHSKEQFVKNMFSENIPPQIHKIRRTTESLKSELESLKKITNYEKPLFYKPSKIIISRDDKIIPAKNQSRYWKVEPNFEGGHCPFFKFSKWEQLL